MRPLQSLLVYLLAVFGGGALVVPWVYWLAQASGVPFLAGVAFPRMLSRTFMVIALIGLWPWLRSSGLKRWRDVGVVPWREKGNSLPVGFAVGFGSLAVVAAVVLIAGVREINQGLTAESLVKHIGNALLAAVGVAVAEELVFRGALFGSLRRGMPWLPALILSSSIFAVVHFFARVSAPNAVGWTTGFEVFGKMFVLLADSRETVPAFLCLALVGAILAFGYQRTSNLYFSIGLHGGWIFWQKSYGFFTVAKENTDSSFWGSGKLIDGWFTFIVLVLTLTYVFWWFNPRKFDTQRVSRDGEK